MNRTKAPTTTTMAAAGLLAATALLSTAAPAAAAVRTPTFETRIAPVMDTAQEATTGTSTGDGPATQDDCEFFAGVANQYVKEAEGALIDGDDAQAGYLLDLADEVEDHAMDEGCVIVYS